MPSRLQHINSIRQACTVRRSTVSEKSGSRTLTWLWPLCCFAILELPFWPSATSLLKVLVSRSACAASTTSAGVSLFVLRSPPFLRSTWTSLRGFSVLAVLIGSSKSLLSLSLLDSESELLLGSSSPEESLLLLSESLKLLLLEADASLEELLLSESLPEELESAHEVSQGDECSF